MVSNLLFAPLFESGKCRKVYLPLGFWRVFLRNSFQSPISQLHCQTEQIFAQPNRHFRCKIYTCGPYAPFRRDPRFRALMVRVRETR
jgi:hypothetical protein